MNSRHQQLIELLNTATGPLTAASLADRLHVSSRSIISYIAAINRELPGSIRSSHYGYQLDSRQGSHLMLTAALDETPQNAEERLSALLVDLLLRHSQGTDIARFAEKTCISLESIRKDIALLRSRLKNLPVTLTRQQDKLILTGDEAELRQLLSHALHAKYPGKLTLIQLQQIFPARDPDALQLRLEQIFRQHGFLLNDCLWPELLLDLLITSSRIQAGFSLPESQDDSRPSAPDLIESSSRIFQPQRKDRLLSPAEYQAWGQLLSAYLIPADFADQSYDGLIRQLPAATRQTLQQLFQALPSALPFLECTDRFRCRFALNFSSLCQRQLLGRQTNNPQSSGIKQASPFAFLCTDTIIRLLSRETQLQFSTDDTAYMAVHVALQLQSQTAPGGEPVDCALLIPPYFDYDQDLRRRLTYLFGNDLHILADIPHERGLTVVLDARLVISTVPLPADFPIDWVETDPLLSESVRINIRRHIQKQQQQRRQQCLHNFLEAAGSLSSRLMEQIQSAGLTAVHHIGLLPLALRKNGRSRLQVQIPVRPFLYHGQRIDLLMALHLDSREWETVQYNLDQLIRCLQPASSRRQIKQAQTWQEFTAIACACLK